MSLCMRKTRKELEQSYKELQENQAQLKAEQEKLGSRVGCTFEITISVD